MKKTFLNTLALLLFPLLSLANLVFDAEGEYMITCYDTGKGGVLQPEGGEFPLIYQPTTSVDNDRIFWTIKEESPDRYSFRNVATGQYLKSDPANVAGKYVSMTNSLEGDTTLFAIDERKVGQETYYAVHSVADPAYYFNKRANGSFGTYSVSGGTSNNELFLFQERNTLIEGGAGALYRFLNSFALNEKEMIAANNGVYYFSIAYDLDKTNATLMVTYEAKDAGYVVKFNGEEITDGQELVIENPTTPAGHKIEILQDNKIVAAEKLIITSLPIVQLYSEGNYLSANFSLGKIRVNEGAKTSTQTGELLHSEMRYRGASAMGQSKKSFAIKLKNESGGSVERSFFGLRNDNYWILDAMAIDRMRMRNRVATDLWNDFSADPHYKSEEKNLINGTRGQYVEVFLDDEYWGLYCMTERIDRKQLKLKKYQEETESIRGVLYKSSTWTYSVMLGYVPDRGPDRSYYIPSFNNRSETWDGYEVKYPDMEEGEPVNWLPLYETVDMTGKAADASFKNGVEYYFDLPVWVDYYLLIELIMATDNHGKNVYLSIYDINEGHKMLVTPWDLDGSFGRRWDAGTVMPGQNFVNFLIQREHGEYNIYKRLQQNNVAGFNDLLKKRYDELRFTWFSEESLVNRFETYLKVFETSGAATREKERWGVNVNGEMDYIAGWIRDRLYYLNDQYGEPVVVPDPVGIDEVMNLSNVYPNPVKDRLYIDKIMPGDEIVVYTETGLKIYGDRANSTSATVDFSGFAQGIYLLKTGKAKKVIIKNT